MLGGAMLSGIILVVFILCYCCHKTNRKCQSSLPSYWRDPALSMEIYTVEAAQTWLVSDELSSELQIPATPGPPPAYEAVVPMEKTINFIEEDDTGLPSYETAVQHMCHKQHSNPPFVTTTTNNNLIHNDSLSSSKACLTRPATSAAAAPSNVDPIHTIRLGSSSSSSIMHETPVFRAANVRPSSAGSYCMSSGRRASGTLGLIHTFGGASSLRSNDGTVHSWNGCGSGHL